MRTTISAIKADIGSIGGHLQPSRRSLDSVRLRAEARVLETAAP